MNFYKKWIPFLKMTLKLEIYIIKIAMTTAASSSAAAADRSLSWRNLAKIPLESNVLGVKNAGYLATAKKKQNT